MTREEVYKAIDTEREYQEGKWPGHKHSLIEFAVYIEHYINQIKYNGSTSDDNLANILNADNMRKIAALAVSAIEQHGCTERIVLTTDFPVKSNKFTEAGTDFKNMIPPVRIPFEKVKADNKWVDGDFYDEVKE